MSDYLSNRAKYLMLAYIAAQPLKMMLLGTGYSEDPDDSVASDISGDEISTTNYARAALSNAALSQDDANDRALLTFDPVVFTLVGTPSGPTVNHAAIIIDTGDDATSEIVAKYDCVKTLTGGTFTVTLDATGALRIT